MSSEMNLYDSQVPARLEKLGITLEELYELPLLLQRRLSFKTIVVELNGLDEPTHRLQSGRKVWLYECQTVPDDIQGEDLRYIQNLIRKGYTPMIVYQGTDYAMLGMQKMYRNEVN